MTTSAPGPPQEERPNTSGCRVRMKIPTRHSGTPAAIRHSHISDIMPVAGGRRPGAVDQPVLDFLEFGGIHDACICDASPANVKAGMGGLRLSADFRQHLRHDRLQFGQMNRRYFPKLRVIKSAGIRAARYCRFRQWNSTARQDIWRGNPEATLWRLPKRSARRAPPRVDADSCLGIARMKDRETVMATPSISSRI